MSLTLTWGVYKVEMAIISDFDVSWPSCWSEVPEMVPYSGGTVAQLCICSAKKSVNLNVRELWGHFRKCFSWGIKKCESLVAQNGAPKRFHMPKNIGFDSQFKSGVCSELGLLLLQPLQPVLGLQMGLRLLKIVPNDLPYPKTWGLTPKSSL